MKRAIILSVFVLALAASTGISSGQTVVKETREHKGFTKVGFGVSGTLYINFGHEFKVVLEGERKVLDDIITEVNGDRLVIKVENWRNWRFRTNDKITAWVTLPELDGVGVSGSGRVEIRDPVKSGDLDLSVSGSGKLYTADISVSRLDCSISGSGDIFLGGGTAEKADIGISGSGNFNGDPAKITDAEIHISGSGNCSCNVTENLKASVSGSGNVSYDGNPRVDAHVSGSGKVRSK